MLPSPSSLYLSKMDAVEVTVALLIFASFITISAVPLTHQTLHPHPLPKYALSQTLKPEFHTQPLQTLPRSGNTLSLDLHHIDALSPTAVPASLFTLRLRRDALRVEALITLAASRNNASRDFSSSIISGLAQGSGEYFTRIGVGTPPKYVYMVLDTGSDVVWVQCSPCRKCYTQSDPVFNPRASKSYIGISCASPLCRRLDSPGCSSSRKCLYEVSYGDGSFTVGEFSTETLTFRGTRVGGVALGCGHDNEGLFVGAAGLLGLGRGKLSFPSQAGDRFGRKFSYCLVDRSASSKPSSMLFGEAGVSRRAVFTPLLTNPKLDTFYYVSLTGISVGGARVAGISSSLFNLDSMGNGGVIVDSGTSVTRLTRPAYLALRNAFRAGASNLKRAPDFSLFDTCFDLSGKAEVKVPTVVLHFVGADVSLPATNYLIPVDSDGRFCFAFAGTMSGLSIIGNIQQQGFRVVFDLERNQDVEKSGAGADGIVHRERTPDVILGPHQEPSQLAGGAPQASDWDSHRTTARSGLIRFQAAAKDLVNNYYLVPPPPPVYFEGPPVQVPVSLSPTLAMPSRMPLLSMVLAVASKSVVRRELEILGDIQAAQMERCREGLVMVHFYDARDTQVALSIIKKQYMKQQFRHGHHFEAAVFSNSISAAPPSPPGARGHIAVFYK